MKVTFIQMETDSADDVGRLLEVVMQSRGLAVSVPPTQVKQIQDTKPLVSTPLPTPHKTRGGYRKPTNGVMTLADAVRTAVREQPRATAEVIDRCSEILPGVKRESVYTALHGFKARGQMTVDQQGNWGAVTPA